MRSDNINDNDAKLLMKDIAVVDAARSQGGHASVTAVIMQNGIRHYGFNKLGMNKPEHACLHAESEAIKSAASDYQIDLAGSSLITTRFPCEYCAAQIIWNNIACVISPPIREDSKWVESQRIAKRILGYAGVSVREIIVEGVRG